MKWIQIADLHLNIRGVENSRIRKRLIDLLKDLHFDPDYIFFAGDLRYAPQKEFDPSTASYIKKLCEAANVSIEHFYIVPGNHDINRECKERNDAIDRFYNTSNRKNSYYRSDVGEIKDEDLMAIGLSKADFNGIVSTVYDGNLDRISLYTNPLKPHFLIKESNLNIVHLDSTISYSSHQQNNLIIGTLPLMEVLDEIDNDNPTVILTHYSFDFLDRDEQIQILNLLMDHNIKLWLAGHEHTNLARKQRDYFYEFQCGNLYKEQDARACILLGEIQNGTVKVTAYSWSSPNDWVKYPFINPTGDNKEYYEFKLYDSQRLNIEGNDEKDRELHDFSEVVKDKLNENNKFYGFPLLKSITLTEIPSMGNVIGRDNDIVKIVELLEERFVVVLESEGGIGKTAIARKICQIIKSRVIQDPNNSIKHLAWINSSGDLMNDLFSTLPSIGINENAEMMKDRILQWYTNPDNATLIIIDNVIVLPSEEDIKFLSTLSGFTKVLLTTRLKIRGFVTHELKELSEIDAIRVFYYYYLDDLNIDRVAIEEREEYGNVKEVVEKAHRNTLLIELIARMARENEEDPRDLKQLLERIFKKTNKSRQSSTKIDQYSEAEISVIDRIRELYSYETITKERKEILTFFSLFPSDTAIFKKISSWAKFNTKDIKWLIDYGWIKKDDNNDFVMQSIVKESVVLQFPDTRISLDWDCYQEVLDKLSETNDYLNEGLGYLTVRKRIVVANYICDNLIANNYENVISSILFNNIAIANQRLCNWDIALKFFEYAINIAEKFEIPFLPTIYGNVGSYYYYLGNHKKAIDYSLEAIKLSESHHMESSIEMIYHYNNIASAYRGLYKPKKSLDYYLKALRILQQNDDGDCLRKGIILDCIAGIYLDMGRIDKSSNSFNKARYSFEQLNDKNSLDVAVFWDNYARLYIVKGDYASAEKCMNEALQIEEKVVRHVHLDTSKTLNNLGGLYQDTGKLDKALHYYTEALNIRIELLGENHPITAVVYDNIASLYLEEGKLDDAERLYRKNYKIFETAYGENDINVAVALNGLSEVCIRKGDLSKARALKEKAKLIIDAYQLPIIA